jgi:L-2-hydroxyglutarate oxidase LhgO
LYNFGFKQRKIAFEIIRQEVPYFFLRNMVAEMAQLVPAVLSIKQWSKSKPGIRAQLLKKGSLEFVNDFIIEEKFNSIHLLNIVSPGFTSAIPLANFAAKKALLLSNS